MEIKNVSYEVTVEAGEYWLGDPCYFVPDEQWADLLATCDYFNEPIGTVWNNQVLGFQTKWGDGVYKDQHGNKYPVDAGLIGLTPVILAGEVKDETLGRKITVDRYMICTSSDGVLEFGNIIINTDDESEDEDEPIFEDEEEGDDDDD